MAKPIVENGELKSSKFRFTSRHILYGKLRPYLGKITCPDFEGVCSTDILPVLPNKDMDRRYVCYYLQQPHIVDFANSQSSGANLPRLSPTALSQIPLPVPPLSEQKRIAEILDRAEALRAKRRAALALLDELTQSIFLDMFGDPVSNPKGWKQSQLGEICGVGSSKRVFVEELVENGIPFYRGTEIGQLGEGNFVTPSLFITKKHYSSLKSHTGVPQQGDLLLPSICPDGRIFQVNSDAPFYFKDGRVLWIKVDTARLNSSFLRHHLKQVFRSDYSKVASGTTFAELKIFSLQGLNIHVPPIEHQLRFEFAIETIARHRVQLSSHLNCIDQLFASLQHRAFRGEL